MTSSLSWIPIISHIIVTFIIFPFCGTPDLGSSFWGMVLILASTKHLATQVAAGCFIVALFVVLFLAKNVSINEPIFYLVLTVTFWML